MKAFLSICLFWYLFFPGAPMSCYHCFGDDCANPRIQECEAHQEACVSSVLETTIVNSIMSKFHGTAMQCSPASFCLNNYGSISTVGGGSIRSNIQCCYTDRCNNVTASLPEPEEHPQNGIQCPSCLAFNSMECQEVEVFNCTGGETKCIEFAAHISIDFLDEEFDLYVQGCATPNQCFVPPPDEESSPEKVKVIITKRQCTQGNGDLNVQTGESKFSTFWAPPILDTEKDVGGQGNRT